MTASQPQIYCPNINCEAPLNPLGNSVCNHCQTPLMYCYVWAAGGVAAQQPVGSQISGRYCVVAPQVWLDTQPGLPPDVPTELPDEMLPYLYLYPHRLHVPEVYGACPEDGAIDTSGIVLLENVPLDANGHLFPAIAQAWLNASPVRQVYWLWQLLQLWAPLAEQGVAASLLAEENIRVDGWRVRLCQLIWDADVLADAVPAESQEAEADEALPDLSLADLANLWLSWTETAQPEVTEPLKTICHQMQADRADLRAIATQLNQLLLEQAAQLPLYLQLVGLTDPGPSHHHNEDTGYPLTIDGETPDDELLPRLALVCDGIGGHEGGEVASQTAVRSLKLQIQALLTDVVDEYELSLPEVIAKQLEASIRVANNQIASQNDAQSREARQRMGTTLVMATQVPQQIHRPEQAPLENSHELYLANVGDSRAYWITRRYCHRLTVDDDVASREVRMGRSLYHEALRRSDAGSLIQALGTRDAEFLHPTVQRFILEEDGVLLLCSDGLSDNNRVEQFWDDVMEPFFKGKRSLEDTAKAWIAVANQQNGHDNVTVVLLRCRVSSDAPDLLLPSMAPSQAEATSAPDTAIEAEQDSDQTALVGSKGKRRSPLRLLLLLLAIALLGGGIGLAIWSQIDFNGFENFKQQVLPQS